MFLIDAIKPKVEKKLRTFFAQMFRDAREQNKPSFVSFRFRFAGGNKRHIQKNLEKTICYVYFIHLF